MSKKDFFPKRPDSSPTIYVYELVEVATHVGLLKVGYTIRSSQKRIDEQTKTAGIKYKIVFEESAMRNDGSAFTDIPVHGFTVTPVVNLPQESVIDFVCKGFSIAS